MVVGMVKTVVVGRGETVVVVMGGSGGCECRGDMTAYRVSYRRPTIQENVMRRGYIEPRDRGGDRDRVG